MKAVDPREVLRVPEELSARVPAEQRGPGLRRDDVRLLVSGRGGVSHHAFRELPELLRAGDVLVVNTSRTLPAAVDGRLGEEPVVVHFSTRADDGRWSVEVRRPDGHGTTRRRTGDLTWAAVTLPGGLRLVLEGPVDPTGDRLWWARPSAAVGVGVGIGADSGADAEAVLHRYGRPIRYRYTERDQPLSAYQSVFAVPDPDGHGSAEMPSAARPFTARLVARLVSRGVQVAPVSLHTGVASGEAHEPPYPERFAVPPSTAWLVNAARAGGGRIVAVGTTAVRALESAAGPGGPGGVVRAAAGWTDLVVTPERGVRAVDGLLTGLHEPEASHLLMLEALTGRELLCSSYAEAIEQGYLWHEFGDVHLMLPH
ncbi:S-adenosylmethionine:tRNA ribosyltransferase-isomerase [Streptomyces sp. NPDC050610]|uniref:S-adenosylmethionine:tRNA ribosyltransferase-isomerase n=1 Tax=Streptomyces sp. NPDC050610 TaxID=3157097 RepID=UPI003429F939